MDWKLLLPVFAAWLFGTMTTIAASWLKDRRENVEAHEEIKDFVEAGDKKVLGDVMTKVVCEGLRAQCRIEKDNLIEMIRRQEEMTQRICGKIDDLHTFMDKRLHALEIARARANGARVREDDR